MNKNNSVNNNLNNLSYTGGGSKNSKNKNNITSTNKINTKLLKVLSVLFIAMFSAAFLFACVRETQNTQSYMRIHIRAHSNSEADQNVKFLIKDKIVNYLTPFVANVESVGELKQVLESNLSAIENVAKNTLKQNGFSYGASVSLNNELFPTRYYDGVLLPSDYYDAIIVNLGSSEGDNWWCVVYPPLCFIGEENKGTNTIIYKSKLLEIIDKFFK